MSNSADDITLLLYLDGRLDQPARAELEARLATDADLAERLLNLAQLDGDLQLLLAQAGQDVASSSVAAACTSSVGAETHPVQRRFRWAIAGAILVTALTLLVSLLGFRWNTSIAAERQKIARHLVTTDVFSALEDDIDHDRTIDVHHRQLLAQAPYYSANRELYAVCVARLIALRAVSLCKSGAYQASVQEVDRIEALLPLMSGADAYDLQAAAAYVRANSLLALAYEAQQAHTGKEGAYFQEALASIAAALPSMSAATSSTNSNQMLVAHARLSMKQGLIYHRLGANQQASESFAEASRNIQAVPVEYRDSQAWIDAFGRWAADSALPLVRSRQFESALQQLSGAIEMLEHHPIASPYLLGILHSNRADTLFARREAVYPREVSREDLKQEIDDRLTAIQFLQTVAEHQRSSMIRHNIQLNQTRLVLVYTVMEDYPAAHKLAAVALDETDFLTVSNPQLRTSERVLLAIAAAGSADVDARDAEIAVKRSCRLMEQVVGREPPNLPRLMACRSLAQKLDPALRDLVQQAIDVWINESDQPSQN